MEYANSNSELSMHPGIRQDLFDGIKYVKGTRMHGNVLGLDMPYVFLPKWALDMVWSRCCASVSTFSKYDFYTTKALLNDPALWTRYGNDGTRLVFGRCVRYLEAHQMLPISCVNPHKSGSKFFRIL